MLAYALWPEHCRIAGRSGYPDSDLVMLHAAVPGHGTVR